MVSSSLAIKTGFKIESDAMPYHMNMIRQDKSKQRVTGKFIVKVSNGIQNTNEAQQGVIANSMPPSVKEGIGISSGIILFRSRKMMTIYVGKHFSNLTKSADAIVMSKNMKSNPTSCIALNVGQVQELINELINSEKILQTQLTMKDMHHILSLPVTALADLLYSSFNSKENRILLEHVDLLPTEIATEGVVRKSESICARPASAIPKNKNKNWMISYLYPRIIVENRYQETSILEKSEWKTSFQPITEFREFLFMSTKHSNQPKILLTNQTRRLYNHLNGYFTIIGVQPSIQELLKITMPSSGIEKLSHHKICQNKFLILVGQNEDMAGMKLINEGISLCALLQIIMAK